MARDIVTDVITRSDSRGLPLALARVTSVTVTSVTCNGGNVRETKSRERERAWSCKVALAKIFKTIMAAPGLAVGVGVAVLGAHGVLSRCRFATW
jgi:hypothetical protein